MKEIESLLTSIGLTKQEARCYLALYELREAQTGALSKKSGIATANIYPVLDSLIKKGFVSYRIQNNIRIFIANSSESFNAFIEKKQEELNSQKDKVKQAILQLKISDSLIEPVSNYRYFEGISGIKSMWYELESKLHLLDKKTIIKICSSKAETFETLLAFYDQFHKTRVKLGIKYRLILTKEAKKHGEKRKKQNAEVRYMNLQNEVQWGIVGNMLFMYYATGKVPHSFLISDEKFARSFEFVFDNMWKLAKK